jgi:hypothetical protein
MQHSSAITPLNGSGIPTPLVDVDDTLPVDDAFKHNSTSVRPNSIIAIFASKLYFLPHIYIASITAFFTPSFMLRSTTSLKFIFNDIDISFTFLPLPFLPSQFFFTLYTFFYHLIFIFFHLWERWSQTPKEIE